MSKEGLRVIGCICIMMILFVAILPHKQIQKVEAQAPPQSWKIWEADTAYYRSDKISVYKIQDGNCSIYLAVGEVGGDVNGPVVSMTAGQGCE